MELRHNKIILLIGLFGIIKNNFAESKDVRENVNLEDKMRPCSVQSMSEQRGDQNRFSDLCLKKWNLKYETFCNASSNSDSDICEHLKKKMKDALETIYLSRTNALPEYCYTTKTRGKAFNPKVQFCCDSRIRKKRFEMKSVCCDTLLSNGSRSQCCNQTYISLSSLKRAKCCNGSLIDEDRDTCEETFSGGGDMDYKVKSTQRTNGHTSNKVVYISIPVVFLLILLVGGLYYFAVYKRTLCLKSMQTTHKQTDRPVHTSLQSIDFQICEISTPVQIRRQHLVLRKDGSLMTPINVLEKNINTITFAENLCSSDSVDVQTQTDPKKEINVINSMGKEFCVQQTFERSNRSLQIPCSAVRLTLSQEDVQDRSIKCYASTFRNLAETYRKLDQVMSAEETIVSPAVEFFFPGVKRLKQFACIDMDLGGKGKDLHVWRITSDQGNGKPVSREEIPLKKYVDVTDDSVDAYYEVIRGKLRIFNRRFSWLVCTVCRLEHYGFSLSTRIYAKEEPHTPSSKQVHLTAYILDEVRQLEDYLKIIQEDESCLKYYRKINLPSRVLLEELLEIQLQLFGKTQKTWRPLFGNTEESDFKMSVKIQDITQCHNIRSNGQPFSLDWLFESIPHSITSSSFTFQCKITMTHIPNIDVDTDVPPNTYVINKIVDFSKVEKRHKYNDNDIRPGHPLYRQPVSAFPVTARPTQPAEHHQRGLFSQSSQGESQNIQDDSQNAATQNTAVQNAVMPTESVSNAHGATGVNQLYLPRSGSHASNYDALGARPKTTIDNGRFNNVPKTATAATRRDIITVPNQGLNRSNNNCHDGACHGAHLFSKSAPEIRAHNEFGQSDAVRGELSRSINSYFGSSDRS